jgi:Predicted signal-transduction protein containing cAMP-binding and CBS domains
MVSATTEVEDVMTAPVVTTTPGTPVDEAAQTMLDEGVGSLLVAEDGDAVGVVTATDFLSDVAAGETDPTAAITAYMSEDVVTASAETTVAAAAGKMATADVQHLPVTDETGVVGLLSATDLTAYLSYGEASATE